MCKKKIKISFQAPQLCAVVAKEKISVVTAASAIPSFDAGPGPWKNRGHSVCGEGIRSYNLGGPHSFRFQHSHNIRKDSQKRLFHGYALYVR